MNFFLEAAHLALANYAITKNSFTRIAIVDIIKVTILVAYPLWYSLFSTISGQVLIFAYFYGSFFSLLIYFPFIVELLIKDSKYPIVKLIKEQKDFLTYGSLGCLLYTSPSPRDRG